jgi:hypothetical protein
VPCHVYLAFLNLFYSVHEVQILTKLLKHRPGIYLAGMPLNVRLYSITYQFCPIFFIVPVRS